ncbi:MAG: hypothetical protein AAB774_01090 [Patescibacteria group bacterium]
MERIEGSHTEEQITAAGVETTHSPGQESPTETTESQQVEQQPEAPPAQENVEQAYQMLRRSGDKEVLSQFDPQQQNEIESKQKILTSLAYFIGKDFKIPVQLNQPGAGWHWDFQHNIIRVDPKDLLEKPMDYLRFVISHEGGHRRVSRTEFIPKETWAQPGFSIMMNSIEDPRVNNFVAENYPKFREQMDMSYQMQLEMEQSMKDKAKDELGHQPRFMQASFEYIKQWLKEQNGGFGELSDDLPDEVKEVVAKTLPNAQDSWWRYPSRKEADKSEELITKYAKTSYEINLEEIWPEFKKLVDQDVEDEKMEQKMRDMQKQSGEGEPGEGQPQLPQELKDRLSPEQQQELQGALQQAIDQVHEQQERRRSQQEQPEGGQDQQQEQQEQTAPIDLDSLSEETKQAIRDYIESLPEEVKEELAERARQALQEFENSVSEELRGKLLEDPAEETREQAKVERQTRQSEKTAKELSPEHQAELDKYRELVEKTMEANANVYEEKRREVLETIDKLEDDLRAVFVARRAHMWDSGFRSGKHIDIKRRIQEKAKDVPAMESRAWERREMPQEKDYAISLLVDLSGSMQGEKIDETFKGAIVLSEVLNRLSIDNEILGFNDRIHVFKAFEETMTEEVREKMGAMLSEVSTSRARYNDDGWALEQASERLAKQQASEKFLIPLSDGQPVESPQHSGEEYELENVVERIQKETTQKLIGLGIGRGTGHVEHYYPNSLANVDTKEMSDKLADLIREVIERSDQF